MTGINQASSALNALNQNMQTSLPEPLIRRDMITPKHEMTVFNLLPPNGGSSGNLCGYGFGGLERMRNTISMRKESMDIPNEQAVQNAKLAELKE